MHVSRPKQTVQNVYIIFIYMYSRKFKEKNTLLLCLKIIV